jgi:hypothetical protein
MGSGGRGGVPNLTLHQRGIPGHTGGGIQSHRKATFSGGTMSTPVAMKLGIRVKVGQTPTLVLKKTGSSTPMVLTAITNPLDPVFADLASTFGKDTEEQWFAFTFTWLPGLGVAFDSDLSLAPFPPPLPSTISDNGFQVVTVVFCHANVSFGSGPYSYAISALPGQFSTGFPLSDLRPKPPKKATQKKSAKKPKAKAKKKPRR